MTITFDGRSQQWLVQLPQKLNLLKLPKVAKTAENV